MPLCLQHADFIPRGRLAPGAEKPEGRAGVSRGPWACIRAVTQGARLRRAPYLRISCSLVVVLKCLIILPLNLCFVSEV